MEISVYKPTNDDWYGCYEVSEFPEIKLVTVAFTQTGPDPKNGKGDWRVCVWGTDDCGMEKDFQDETEALNCFYQVIGWKSIDFNPLKDFGFVSA